MSLLMKSNVLAVRFHVSYKVHFNCEHKMLGKGILSFLTSCANCVGDSKLDVCN